MIYAIMWFFSSFSMLFISQRTIKYVIALCLVFSFWFLASFKGAGVDSDYQNYMDYIQEAISYGSSSRGGSIFDSLANILNKLSFPLTAIFSIYALSIPLKFFLFRKFGDMGYAIFIGYVGFFVYLHDFTQIRAGLAIAFAYWGVYYYYSSGKKILSISLLLLSGFIHSSLFSVLAFVIFERALTKNRLLIILLLSVSICAVDGLSNVIANVIQYIGSNDLSLYYQLSIDGQVIKPFGLFPVFNLVLCLLCSFFLRGACKQDKLTDVLMKMFFLSQITWFLFYPIPVLSARVSQIFLFSIVFILPFASSLILKNKYLLPLLYSAIGFIAFNTMGGLMKPYDFIF
ncbi:hypothetical protein EYY87_21675 [Hafnia paralvei]|uniref:EpsG family protein n=1 Tax=Hafnia alvei TaxID=569 RepID=A0A172WZX5_HAFAL|nr:EpsG family protein [Hafnia paralvei]ANF29919.1 hypothetical protein [Hafnia alvei]TBM00965.1 hypothetical protein EYY87_21675 [Hafnia paralvei]